MLNDYFSDFILLFSKFCFLMARIFSIVSIFPVFSEVIVNKKIKIILSFLISILIIPISLNINISILSVYGIFIFIEQIVIGIFIGFFIRLIFLITNIAGEILGLQFGLSFSNIFDYSLKINMSIISNFLNLLMLLLFLCVNGHLWIILIIFKSFSIFPINNIQFHSKIFYIFINYINKIYIYGIILSLPMIVILLGLNIVMGFINRISPQISIFSVGFPIVLLSGIGILLYLIPNICFFLVNVLYNLFFLFR